MKRASILQCFALIIMASALSYGQYGNVWYFGQHAGIDFNSGSPVTITNGALATNEGCASVCDANGDILFYTDGRTVWDANHAAAITGLPGHPSSTQSAVIVPKPSTTNRYFIFMMDEQYSSGINDGMNYLEVELNGGTVIPAGPVVGLQGYMDCTEKLAASCHANGTDYWMTTLRRNGQFVSWPITSAGVGTQVVSTVTALPNNWGGDDRVGYMKINSQGTKLVVARRDALSQSEAFDFDNSTGQVTLNHGVYHTGTVYGVEFSANGNYFYTSENWRFIVMYNSALTPTTIHTRVNSAKNHWLGALQMGPDGNIYVSTGYEGYDGTDLDRIINVENGTPTYQPDAVNLPAGTFSRLGLPDIISCFVPVISSCGVDADFSFVEEYGCEFNFTDLSTTNTGSDIVAWEWTFGDGYSSTEQNPTHYYPGPGTYNVCLTVTAYNGDECCVSTYCQEVTVREQCDVPCEIDHRFDWSIIDTCGQCAVQFNGLVNFSSKPIVAWLYDFGDGTTGSGQNPVHTYTYNGMYNVCVTIIAGNPASGTGSTPGTDSTESECCVYTYCETVVIDCAKDPDPDDPVVSGKSALVPDETIIEDDFNVFPNPTTGHISIEMEMPEAQKVEISLIDLTGNVHWQASDVETAEGTWNHSFNVDVAQGMYLLLVKGDNFSKVKKLRLTDQ